MDTGTVTQQYQRQVHEMGQSARVCHQFEIGCLCDAVELGIVEQSESEQHATLEALRALFAATPIYERPNEDECAHSWVYTGTGYGGDDESYRGEGRCYCSKCGADGDA